jgi:hypothetical protein
MILSGIRKNITMIDPKTVIYGKLKKLNVIYNGGEHQDGNQYSGWSLAEFEYDGHPKIGFRWNGEEGKVGTPQTFGVPIWEILPTVVGEKIKEGLYAYLYERALAVAEVREVEVA